MDVLDRRLRRLANIRSRLDLVQLKYVIEELVLQQRDRRAVLNAFRESAVRGEFGLIEPRYVVRDLLYLSGFDAPLGHMRFRVHRHVAGERIELLWASRAVLRRWLERRQLPIPPWLAKAEAAEEIAKTEPQAETRQYRRDLVRLQPEALIPKLEEMRHVGESRASVIKRLAEQRALPGTGVVETRIRELSRVWSEKTGNK